MQECAEAAHTAERGATCARLHARIRGPAAALGHDPVDVLRGALDVARLAVDAVLRVDLAKGQG